MTTLFRRFWEGRPINQQAGVPALPGLRRVLNIHSVNAAASVLVNTSLTVPPEEIWQITALELKAVPDGAIAARGMHVDLRARDNVLLGSLITAASSTTFSTNIQTPAGDTAAVYWQGSVFVVPGNILLGVCSFSAGIAVNQADLTLYGLVYDAKELGLLIGS